MTAQARLLSGRYQVGELLGYGGMAEVHRGRDLRLGRDVAIKMLRTDLARDATFQMRFRREAQNAASLNHPAIVAVYDTGEEVAPTGETIPFIVMEFVNGRTLKEVLAAEGRLMPRRALEICADICAALEFSHRHGIIHRDIKPGNVMLTVTGQVKVMDFGIARALASGATTMTQTSAVIGTAQYLSPEQARGEAVDARSDVYAAGCVLFELLCGHPPFTGDSPVSVAYQHVREDPPTPSDINRDVGPAIDAIVLKALSKNPINRYQSAAEMRADLLRAAAGRPVMATPVLREEEALAMAPTVVQPAAGGTRQMPAARVGDRRNRKASAWVIATLSGLGVLAVIALVASLWMPDRSKSNEPDPITVPNVIGSNQEAAQRLLTNAGLRPELGETVFGDDCIKGTVAVQNPQANQEVQPDTPVTIQICGGPDEVTIPTGLIGDKYEDVKRELEQLELEVKRKDVDSDADKGEVVALSHKEGDRVAKGATIEVEVSKGNMKQLPNLVGRSKEYADQRLTELGFTNFSFEYEESPADQVGSVIRQDPSGGRAMKTDTRITLTIGKAAEPTDPPSDSPSPSPPPSDGGAATAALRLRD